MHVLRVFRKALLGSSVEPREFPGWWAEPEWWVGGPDFPSAGGQVGTGHDALGLDCPRANLGGLSRPSLIGSSHRPPER